MQKIRGTVERIDDPLEVSLASGTAMLGQSRMTGVCVEQYLDNGVLGLVIDFRDEIVDGFLGHRQDIQIARGSVDDIARASRSLNRGVEHWMHRRGFQQSAISL
jgi:hypothetical protein